MESLTRHQMEEFIRADKIQQIRSRLNHLEKYKSQADFIAGRKQKVGLQLASGPSDGNEAHRLTGVIMAALTGLGLYANYTEFSKASAAGEGIKQKAFMGGQLLCLPPGGPRRHFVQTFDSSALSWLCFSFYSPRATKIFSFLENLFPFSAGEFLPSSSGPPHLWKRCFPLPEKDSDPLS